MYLIFEEFPLKHNEDDFIKFKFFSKSFKNHKKNNNTITNDNYMSNYTNSKLFNLHLKNEKLNIS